MCGDQKFPVVTADKAGRAVLFVSLVVRLISKWRCWPGCDLQGENSKRQS